MLIIPAIDLMNSCVVRLRQGKKDSCTVYSAYPRQIAEKFKAQGAELIHVVDLDAAFSSGNNLIAIKDIIKVGLEVEVGGGIRSLAQANHLIKAGVNRLIIGTKAADEKFLKKLVKEFPGKIGVGVDVLDRQVMLKGWQEKSNYEFIDFIEYLIKQGVDYIIYTDISRDGTLQGFNTASAACLKTVNNVKFVASGGIGCPAHLSAIKQELPFIHGIIVGKAYYEGKINLAEAIALCK